MPRRLYDWTLASLAARALRFFLALGGRFGPPIRGVIEDRRGPVLSLGRTAAPGGFLAVRPLQ